MLLRGSGGWQSAANSRVSGFYNTSDAMWVDQLHTLIYSGFVNAVVRSLLDSPVADVQAASAAVVAANASSYKDPNREHLQLPYCRRPFDLADMSTQRRHRSTALAPSAEPLHGIQK